MIRNAHFIGEYQPPRDSGHAPRRKRIMGGIDSNTNKRARYYERDGKAIHITDEEWPKWRKVVK